MKISNSWVKLEKTRRPPEGLQYRKLRHIRLFGDGRLEIVAEGLPPRFMGWDPREEPKKMLIAEINDDDLVDLYLQLRQQLIEKNIPLPETGQGQTEASAA